MSDEPFTICPTCREKVDPDDPDLVYAVELQRLDHLRGSDYVEGMGAFFHPEHFPGGRWRQKERPS